MFTYLQSSLFQVGVSNAVLATGLALVVLLITRKSRYPAWTHALWVLVLVKLLVPPIYWVTAEMPTSASRVTTMAPRDAHNDLLRDSEPSAIRIDVVEAGTIPASELQGRDVVAASPSSRLSGKLIPWLGIVWLGVAAGVFSVTIYRYSRFKRWLGRSKSAPPDLVDLVRSEAEQIGLERLPEVLLVRGVIAPSVFSLGRRSNLILPLALIEQLTESELRSVVTHELTHLRRGDHWVRLLEIATGAIFWWHPIVPFARRKIQEAADESCDACVISRNPSIARDYASAMLKTVDFLSGATARSHGDEAVMPLMIAIGDSNSLVRRMHQISRSTASPTVSSRGRYWLAAAALLSLPMGMLTLAPELEAEQPPTQESPAGNDKPVGKDEPRQVENKAISNPFGGGNNRSSGSHDPFGGNDDPFGSDDPFDGSSDDPFVDPFFRGKMPSLKDSKTQAERSQAVEDRLRTALRREVSSVFKQARLREAIGILSEITDVPFIIDNLALEGIGLTDDTPVTIGLRNVSLSSYLQLMLRELELTYMIKDEVILITTVEVAEKNPTLKTYTLPIELADRSEKILTALTTNVQPDMWKESGGSSTASMIDNVLVVSTTEAVHNEVETFLRKIETAFQVFQQKQRAAEPGE
ncbi:M56 family metallopeptidase [Allorhodopirellula heiligendammensis]|uniref:Protease HtpX n=1 Tax=Allorhodopirellula heiligendammensis TaxID=2714739 RepID=A0A5C6BKG0_9BACT|nr:M56 family metallopeptidase [Allorhodopirellula heiligendammensis]TWU10934.1 Protease HtpX [Allorhodopirellula heiligendammensis]